MWCYPLGPGSHDATAWLSYALVAVIRFYVAALAVLTAFPVAAQPALWSDVPASRAPARTDLTEYRVVQLDLEAMRELLAPAPGARRATTIDIPLPEGGFAEVTMTEGSVMAPALQERYPQIRTYTAQGVSTSGRLAVTPHGASGLLYDVNGGIVIDPIGSPDALDAELYAVYRTSSMIIPANVLESLVDDMVILDDLPEPPPAPRRRSVGESLRTYRLAVAAKSEFTASRGGTVELGLAAVVASVNRVNAIYERDLALRFELVANNDLIIYTDAANDPFTAAGGALLSQNQAAIDGQIGSANYDVGHLISFDEGGGLAVLRSACSTQSKSAAYSGVGNETSAFDLLVFPHELGHQLGAPHSWVSFQDGVQPNADGYEPGPGYTLMGYPHFASYRPSAERVGFHFHAGSLDAMEAHVFNGGGQCGTDTPTGNDVPVVSASVDAITIPLGAFFTLDGSATDNSGTELSYTWEQLDRYGSGAGAIPRFRVFDPGPSTSRTFPDLDRILTGNPYPDELGLDRGTTYTFQLTARDNVAGGGGVGEDRVSVTVVDQAGAFTITSLEQFVVFQPGADMDLRWNVAGSDGGAIGAATVDIMLSVDNGDTWTLAAAGVPNDGQETITLPATTTVGGRVMIQPVGKPFFTVNETAFEIGAAPAASVSMESIDVALEVGEVETTTLTVSNTAGASTELDYEIRLENVVLPGGSSDDGTGYTFATSSDAGGPAAGFEDLSTTGGIELSFQPTLADVPASDDGAVRLSIPFSFPFFDRTYRRVNVSTNGLLVFTTDAPHDAENRSIPTGTAPNAVIAPMWDDLALGSGAVYAKILNDGRFAVQWNTVGRFQGVGTYTFQVILSEDGTIEMQYGSLSGILNSATVGIENEPGDVGVEVAFNESFLASNTALRFDPVRQWLTLSRVGGQIGGGGAQEVGVTTDARGLSDGDLLSADVVFLTSDGSQARIVVPVTLRVGTPVSNEADPEAAVVSLAAPNPASSRAVVRVALATPSRIRATLHDALGRQVAVIWDGDASGAIDLDIEAGALAAGVYLVRVAGDGFVQTRQLVVAR